MVVDKGTLDAVGLRSDAQEARHQYRQAVARLLRPGGLLVITSCNSSKDELVCEFTGMTTEGAICRTTADPDQTQHWRHSTQNFSYVDHVRTYPTFKFGGQQGSQVCTVAFLRQALCHWHLVTHAYIGIGLNFDTCQY